MTKNIVAFCGETFFKGEFNKNTYVAKPTSAAFLQDIFGQNNIYVVSPFTDEVLSGGISSVVDESFFYEAPYYSSTKDFFVKLLLKPSFYREFVSFCDEIISIHKGSYFWVRTPSIGSIFFGLRVLQHDQTLLHHMCADASSTWKDAKYKGLNKLLAYITSRYLRFLLARICSHPNAINFCTGDVLENFSRKYSAKTHQFVDVMVKSVDVSGLKPYQKMPGKLNLLFVGRMVDDKGIFDLIKVLKQLKENVSLTFVGDGPDLEKAKLLSDSEGLSDVITFTGQLPHSELAAVFHKSDLITVPSNNNYEGFPRVIMEAWSFHKPVIVSNVGGINAFVKDGENGIIIQPGQVDQLRQALVECLNDENYERICEGAKKIADKSFQAYWIHMLKDKLGGYDVSA
ncbi:glycosyltransferase [Agarivorans sp. QJM3NY_33]|uniref:glycosyltransferase n=1 Tax=Agarivorans sp. QJM3NY_33 TaxID=3421432 RepID=UPI003D7ED750